MSRTYTINLAPLRDELMAELASLRRELFQEEKTMKPLDEWIKRAEEIQANQKLTQHGKDVRLAGLMSEMEGEYQIPVLKNEAWEQQHPDVIRTYRQISDMREL